MAKKLDMELHNSKRSYIYRIDPITFKTKEYKNTEELLADNPEVEDGKLAFALIGCRPVYKGYIWVNYPTHRLRLYDVDKAMRKDFMVKYARANFKVSNGTREFNGIDKAAEYCVDTGLSKGTVERAIQQIQRCLNGQAKTAYGYKWVKSGIIKEKPFI